MSLATRLDSTTPLHREAPPPVTFAGAGRPGAGLRGSGPVPRAVGVGELIALPILRTPDGEPVDLIEVAADRPAVLVFFRGGWCPWCAAALRAYAAALPRIEAAGGTLVAVTPERPARALEAARNGLRFAVDGGNRFAKSLGLVAASDGGDGRELPVPATYVLAPCGRVTWAHVDPDFTRRADPDDVVAALERLAAAGPADRAATTPGHAWGAIL